MQTNQVVLDKKLLQEADRAARRTKRNRSPLIRDALRQHLRMLEIQAHEDRDREGYMGRRAAREESVVWEAKAVWQSE